MTKVNPVRLARRTFLRGSVGGAGVMVGLGALDAMFDGRGRAYGAAPTKRFVTAFFGNGIYHPAWVPNTQGAAPQLPESLALLAPVRSHVRIVTGMDNTGGGGAHALGLKATLLGLGNTSADQIAVPHLGSGRFPSLQYALFKIVKTNLFYGAMSFSKGSPLPPELNPRKAFDRLFGSTGAGGAPDPGLEKLRKRRLSVLDAVGGQIARLEGQLGAEDRAKLDQHLTSVRELERSLTPAPMSSGAGACTLAKDPPAAATDYPTIGKQFNEIITLALACDQTRVVSYMISSALNTQMPPFPIPGKVENFHDCSHGPGWEAKITVIVRWKVGVFADLVARLARTPDGPGSGKLIDSTGLILTSETGKAFDHGGKDMPILLAGGPSILKGDFHWRGSRGSAAATLSLLKALGCPLTSLGRETGSIPLT
jgi:hypothetical protein